MVSIVKAEIEHCYYGKRYELKKLDEMFAYYASKGCDVKKKGDYTDGGNTI